MNDSCTAQQAVFSCNKQPKLKIFTNYDDTKICESRLARCIYAETLSSSLHAIEQLCVMVRNTNRDLMEISGDESVFESLNPNSRRHKELLINYDNPKFKICIRAVQNMKKLPDKIMNATRFHRTDTIPDWATAIGSIAEIDDLLFYKD